MYALGVPQGYRPYDVFYATNEKSKFSEPEQAGFGCIAAVSTATLTLR
jgi:hypothetical protein